MTREARLGEVFVTLADSLTADFDAIDLLHYLADVCVELLDIDSAGIMLDDLRGGLRLAASSDDLMHDLEVVELSSGQGPCLDCFSLGVPVTNVVGAEAMERWPIFITAAKEVGAQATHALPLRLRGHVIGAMNLCSTTSRTLSPEDIALGQALADMATISMLQERATSEQFTLASELQSALNNRIVIEQAKGMLAEQQHLTPAAAYGLLRNYARSHDHRLLLVAQSVLAGRVDFADNALREV